MVSPNVASVAPASSWGRANASSCFGARERGSCSNHLTIRRGEVEARVQAVEPGSLRGALPGVHARGESPTQGRTWAAWPAHVVNWSSSRDDGRSSSSQVWMTCPDLCERRTHRSWGTSRSTRTAARARRPAEGAAPPEHGVALPFEGQSAKRSPETGDPSLQVEAVAGAARQRGAHEFSGAVLSTIVTGNRERLATPGHRVLGTHGRGVPQRRLDWAVGGSRE